MAQASISVLLEGLRGKAGSVVFVKSKDGVVVRPRVTPTNPRTAAQTAVRSNLGHASTLYKNMTVTQAAQWGDYAATQISRNSETGKSRKLSAITAFTQLSSKFLQVNPIGTVPMTPPTGAFTGDTVVVTADVSGTDVIFTASGANRSGVVTEVLLQRLPSQNRTPTARGYRAQGFHAFPAQPNTFAASATPGNYVPAYRFVETATGRATQLVVLPPVKMA